MGKDDKRLNEVIRVQKRASNFVMIDKTFLENDGLSWKAKGILAYLLSKPDNWKVIVSNIVNNATDGKTAVYNGLKELSEQGYYVKRPIRNGQGTRIVQWESIVFESPEDSKNLDNAAVPLLPGFQEIENLDIDNQDIENQPLIKNYYNNKDFNKNQSSQVLSDRQDRTDTLTAYTQLIKSNIEYASFLGTEKALVDEMIAIMLDVITTKGECITINGEKKNREHVKSQLLKLHNGHITHVIDTYKGLESPVTKKRQYILTMLYNTSMEYEAHCTLY